MNSDKNIISELNDILLKTSQTEKHKGYHILPERLANKLNDSNLMTNSVFYEKERLNFFISKFDFNSKSILDIGCNTGYFLFSLLDIGASNVEGYEGKELCASFAKRAIQLLKEEKRFEVHHGYYDFLNQENNYDVVFLLNVLHHVGDDYGDKALSKEKAKIKIIEQLNGLSSISSNLVFQMGFNWQGNIKQSLFENGTKKEMIDFIKNGTKKYWNIKAIGIAEKMGNYIKYEDLNDNNISRDDSLGEFLNRPLFILEKI